MEVIHCSLARCNMSNPRKSVSSDIQTLRSGLKNEAQAEFFKPTRCDETLFRVSDIASQSINNSWKNSKQKFTGFYDNGPFAAERSRGTKIAVLESK